MPLTLSSPASRTRARSLRASPARATTSRPRSPGAARPRAQEPSPHRGRPGRARPQGAEEDLGPLGRLRPAARRQRSAGGGRPSGLPAGTLQGKNDWSAPATAARARPSDATGTSTSSTRSTRSCGDLGPPTEAQVEAAMTGLTCWRKPSSWARTRRSRRRPSSPKRRSVFHSLSPLVAELAQYPQVFKVLRTPPPPPSIRIRSSSPANGAGVSPMRSSTRRAQTSSKLAPLTKG